MSKQEMSVNDLFPESARLLLTGGGKEFVERVGVEVSRQIIVRIMMGENVRNETEPLSRRRIAQTSAAMIALFANGWLTIENFTDRISRLALEQIKRSRKTDNASIWISQWLIGLTGKSFQNVLRSNPEEIDEYIRDFETAVEEAANKSLEYGDLKMTLGFLEDQTGRKVELGWKEIIRITTAIGSQTLTIRGSDKSIYGKLFEKLVLGSILTILGFERVDRNKNTKTSRVFWLSDSSDDRESDATLVYEPGRVIRFDIGFIGKGNSEISKDKLSRYSREFETNSGSSNSITFIIVDKLPETGKTVLAAQKIGAEIIQMSMQYWTRTLAQKLSDRIGFNHELQAIADSEMYSYLDEKMTNISIQDFLTGLSPLEINSLDDRVETIDDDE